MPADHVSLDEIHDLTRRSFIEADASIVQPYIGDRELALSDGSSREESLAEWEERFARVLASARFERWVDLEPPRWGVSADGTMAWLVEVVELAGTRARAPFVTK